MHRVWPHNSTRFRRMTPLNFCWDEFLYNPLWYVTTVSCLAGLTYYIHFWGWLTVGVSLIWGVGLVWHIFSQDETGLAGEEQLQAWLDQAFLYQAQIDQALGSTPSRNKSFYEPNLTAQVNAWVKLIQDLIQRLALLRRNHLIRQELVEIPKAIAALETQLAGTSAVALRSQLEQALTHRRHQLVLLNGLQSRMKQAEIQIEHTLSLLSTLYSQILTGQSIRHIADYQRLLPNLEEEVYRLQDQLEALHELKEGEFSSPASRFQCSTEW